jgi:hypothetical protein
MNLMERLHGIAGELAKTVFGFAKKAAGNKPEYGKKNLTKPPFFVKLY